MKVIDARNVNSAYDQGLRWLREVGELQRSRVGDVLVAPTPVTTVYQRPRERVLFDPKRDANPIFHVAEALWMLAGRRDAKWLDRFVKDFSSRFAEDDGTQWGAYGFRWRQHFELAGGGSFHGTDQLNTIVSLLQKNPDDRRIVLQMWDPVIDLGADKRDLPCNVTAFFRTRRGDVDHTGDHTESVLDLTVFCRSNDILYGAYGANSVHFSVLLEYMAARIGVEVGRYYQISNNFHAYTDILDKVGTPTTVDDPYTLDKVHPQRMFTVPAAIDEDLAQFMEWTDDGIGDDEFLECPYTFYNSWFTYTALPLMEAHWHWKHGNRNIALAIVKDPFNLMASDWQLAARQWMERRS